MTYAVMLDWFMMEDSDKRLAAVEKLDEALRSSESSEPSRAEELGPAVND